MHLKNLIKKVCLFLAVFAFAAGMGATVASANVLTSEPVDMTVSAEGVGESIPEETEQMEMSEGAEFDSQDLLTAAENTPSQELREVPETENTVAPVMAEESAVSTLEEPEIVRAPSPEELVVADTEHYRKVPLYFQTDYPNNMYGSGSIANNGCSVTCLAMVATYLTDHEYLPDELARYFGGVAENNIERLENGAETMQLPWQKLENFHRAMEALKEGKIVIALMGAESIFTAGQHFIVLTGFNEKGLIEVNDPYGPNYEKWDLKRAFGEGFTEGDICCGFEGAWAFDKNAMPEEPFLYFEEELREESRYPDLNLTDEDIELLASLVWAEARGECEEGQQAVAEIVLNRLISDEFADTVKDVIYADGQFRSVDVLKDAEPYQAQYDAIDRAIHGPYILPEDVVHFATFRTNDNVWGQIGGHIFCYQY